MSDARKKIIQDVMRNKGIHIINPPPSNEKHKTIIVLGCARSGTSMVAGTLNKLGVSVGRQHDNATFEDIELSQAFETNNMAKVEDIVNRYNSENIIWGWKRPGLLNYFEKTNGKFRNPYYIAIFKDIFSIANRNKISMESDLLENMSSVMQDHLKLIQILKKLDAPCLILSNEKVLQNKEDAVTAISKFIGTGTPEQIDEAITFITPNRTTYLDSTRKNRTVGFFDAISGDIARGWAKSAFNNEQVEVELLINDKLIKTSSANIFREDLKNSGHGSGDHAFKFNLSTLNLTTGDSISIRVKGDIIELTNSPLAYKKN